MKWGGSLLMWFEPLQKQVIFTLAAGPSCHLLTILKMLINFKNDYQE